MSKKRFSLPKKEILEHFYISRLGYYKSKKSIKKYYRNKYVIATILHIFHKVLAERLMDSERVDLPCGLGSLSVVKFRPRSLDSSKDPFKIKTNGWHYNLMWEKGDIKNIDKYIFKQYLMSVEKSMNKTKIQKRVEEDGWDTIFVTDEYTYKQTRK